MVTKKRTTTKRAPERDDDEPVSLAPLKPEEAIAGLLRVKPSDPRRGTKKKETEPE